MILFALKYWQLLAGATVSLALGVMLATTTIDRNQWRAAARAGDVALAKVKAAQPLAEAAQIAANHAPVAQSQTIAEKSNETAPAYYDAVRGAVAARTTIVRKDAVCPPRDSDLPRADHAPPIDDRPVAATGMVSRAKADDDLIVAAAGRASQMHADAQALIDAGVAVPSEVAPTP